MEGFDYDTFFHQYVILWRDQSTLAQFEEFDEFYDIREGDGMYLSPEDRVAVWQTGRCRWKHSSNF